MSSYTWYKLVDKKPIIDETNGAWFKLNKHLLKLAHTKITKEIEVITIFLSLSAENEPKLFETSVNGRHAPNILMRFATYDEALRGHEAICNEVRFLLNL